MQKKVRLSAKTEKKYQRVLKIKFADPEYFASAVKLTEDELRDPDDDVLKNLVSKGLVVWDKDSLHMLYSLPEDSITVKGCVKVFACCVPLKTKPINESSSRDISPEMHNSELIDHLKSAFINGMESGEFTDVTLWLQGESVRAHKFILSARSPKFKRLLEPDSDGYSVNELVIRGIDKNTFEHFLHYLYTGIVGAVKWEMIEKLYELAIDFEVNSLLEHCRRKLILSLKDRRADRALLFAENHKDEVIKKATISFIKDIFFKYKNTNLWTSFRDNHPGLATEVMNCVVDSIK